jgi:hypothetical protein
MGGDTLHAVSVEVEEQLIRAVLGRRVNWSAFHRLHHRTAEILRSVGLSFDRLPRRPFGLRADQPQKIALQLLSLYQTEANQGIIPESLFRFSRRKLGLKETTRYLRGLYQKHAYPELALEFGFVLAQLSYLTLPTWRTGGMGLSFLWRIGWSPLVGVAKNPAHRLFNSNQLAARPLESSFSAGIYLDCAGVSEIERALRSADREKLIRMAGAKQVPITEFEPAINRITEAVIFACEYGCGLIEATGILDEDSMVTPV